jgi:hypothetical protein
MMNRLTDKMKIRFNLHGIQHVRVSHVFQRHRFPVLLFSLPVIVYILYVILFNLTPALYHVMFHVRSSGGKDPITVVADDQSDKLIKVKEIHIKNLEKAFGKYKNTQPYLVVNTTENSFSLYNRGKLVRAGMCSTGSYILLIAGDEKKWKFETPKGLFRIQGKTETPVWKKPDWAFVEEGLPVPPSFSHLRYERGVLGDYALSIGDGYLIHGTLYKRLLGMPVTHGCIRMDDEDLEAVYHLLGIGSKVYIL